MIDKMEDRVKHAFNHFLSRVVVPASIHLCQRSFYKSFVKFRNSEKNVLKIVFEMSDLFSSLLIFTIIKTILGTFFYCFQILQKSCKMSVDRGVVELSGNDNSG
jgi:hypothetical protein